MSSEIKKTLRFSIICISLLISISIFSKDPDSITSEDTNKKQIKLLNDFMDTKNPITQKKSFKSFITDWANCLKSDINFEKKQELKDAYNNLVKLSNVKDYEEAKKQLTKYSEGPYLAPKLKTQFGTIYYKYCMNEALKKRIKT